MSKTHRLPSLLSAPEEETTPLLPGLVGENSLALDQLPEAPSTCSPMDCLTAPFRALGDCFSRLFGCDEEEEVEEAEDEETALEERLRTNNFRVGAGLDAYAAGFHPGFRGKLDSLGPDSRWLDGGSGNAQAMQDLVEARGGPGSGALPQMVATAYERPTGAKAGTLDGFEQQMNQQAPGRFQYNSGKFFGQLTNDELGVNPEDPSTLMDLITDQSGVMLYTHTLSEDLQRYLDLLRVGGEIYTSNFGSLSIDDQLHGGQDMISNWLSGVEGLEMARGGADAFRFRKTQPEVRIPALQRTAGDDTSFPPRRDFRRV